MPIKVNLSETEVQDFDPIPIGLYPAFVTDGEIREAGPNAKHPGSSYINWEFTINGGAHDGRKQWLNTSLLPEALFGLKGLLQATGDYTEEELESEELEFEISDVITSEVVIRVGMKKFEGENRNDVKKVLPVSTEVPSTPPEASASMLP